MRDKFARDIFESWLKKIELVDEFKNYILISVSTRFIRDWITSRYLDQILQIVKKYNKDIIRIEFIVEDNNKAILNNSESNTNDRNKSLINDNVSFIKVIRHKMWKKKFLEK
jgi:chromosomal replication initiator protein